MPRKFIRSILPDTHALRTHKHLRLFGDLLHDPNLWHLNRHSVAGAFAVGLFVAFLPIPFQMVLAAAIAIFVRTNLPISVALVWLTNPLTMPPLFYFSYKLGSWLLGMPPAAVRFDPSLAWFLDEIGGVWKPLLSGSLILGLAASILGYAMTHLLWRLHIISHLRNRRRARKDLPPSPPADQA
jgi:uncharacterized protein (DUF2062 family)